MIEKQVYRNNNSTKLLSQGDGKVNHNFDTRKNNSKFIEISGSRNSGRALLLFSGNLRSLWVIQRLMVILKFWRRGSFYWKGVEIVASKMSMFPSVSGRTHRVLYHNTQLRRGPVHLFFFFFLSTVMIQSELAIHV